MGSDGPVLAVVEAVVRQNVVIADGRSPPTRLAGPLRSGRSSWGPGTAGTSSRCEPTFAATS
jgi:hypothetical protein